MENNIKYMKKALEQAKKAEKKQDFPVGCVITYKNKVIAKAYNKKEKNKIATKHAEIIAIEKACKKLKTWHLDDCILYTTLEPCVMCSGAIIQSRIKKVVYATKNENFGAVESNYNIFDGMIKKKKIIFITDVCKEESEKILTRFFKKMR